MVGSSPKFTRWKEREVQKLHGLVLQGTSWKEIAKQFPNRTIGSCQRQYHKSPSKSVFTAERIKQFRKVFDSGGTVEQASEHLTPSMVPQFTEIWANFRRNDNMERPQVGDPSEYASRGSRRSTRLQHVNEPSNETAANRNGTLDKQQDGMVIDLTAETEMPSVSPGRSVRLDQALSGPSGGQSEGQNLDLQDERNSKSIDVLDGFTGSERVPKEEVALDLMAALEAGFGEEDFRPEPPPVKVEPIEIDESSDEEDKQMAAELATYRAEIKNLKRAVERKTRRERLQKTKAEIEALKRQLKNSK